ncbi:MAG: class I SAM-dependent methyltransferase [Bacteroidetes bacterium]|nr:class I SAM-dependent methyltransferase [Bacteroidota bacterium]
MTKFQPEATDYDGWFDRHPVLFQSELAAIRSVLPAFQKGVEIGAGTGRFASALGIRHELEPLDDYAEIASSRGIEVVKGVAEQMPYADGSFDLALLVTVDCFLDDVPKAFAEASRILEEGGTFVVAILDKNGAIAKKYERSGFPSYQNAHFHSPAEIVGWMTEAGFSDFRFAQTLVAEGPASPEAPHTGVGRGSFAVVLGRKNLGTDS